MRKEAKKYTLYDLVLVRQTNPIYMCACLQWLYEYRESYGRIHSTCYQWRCWRIRYLEVTQNILRTQCDFKMCFILLKNVWHDPTYITLLYKEMHWQNNHQISNGGGISGNFSFFPIISIYYSNFLYWASVIYIIKYKANTVDKKGKI